MNVIITPDEVILDPKSLTLAAGDWEDVYAQLCVARDDWQTLAYYGVGDWKTWCEEQRDRCADLAEKINRALSIRKVTE